jgi:A/G-specific adenine glycosylase
LNHVSATRPIPADLQAAILDWYREHGRALAFRGTTDPYAILVAETMAQQTQVARAADRWEQFMARFPTVADLAAATPADVLREWQGLGYNRRGLNLWRAANVIVSTHGGRVPTNLDALEALPGVGPYTARAVAACAFGLPVAPLDVNVRRVIGRIVVADEDRTAARDLQRVADAAVPDGQAAEWMHALMDIGATVCLPTSPRCEACPARPWCGTAAAGRPSAPRSRARRPKAAFPSTRRWLRGRILDRLRLAPDGAWVRLDAPIGTHDAAAVRSAAKAMATDGVIELHATEVASLSARLPLA